jgi:hypothetical protein
VTNGWDRASVRFRSRPSRFESDVTRNDLFVPGGGSKVVLFGACAACGGMLAVLWGYFGQMFFTLFVGVDPGWWFWWVVLGIGIAATLLLFTFAVRDRKRDAEWLERY